MRKSKMSKSVYEEALHNAQTLLALVNVDEINAAKKYDMLNQIEKALEQAHQQEKLLNKIKEVIYRPYSFYDDERPINIYRYKEIENHISELENREIIDSINETRNLKTWLK